MTGILSLEVMYTFFLLVPKPGTLNINTYASDKAACAGYVGRCAAKKEEE